MNNLNAKDYEIVLRKWRDAFDIIINTLPTKDHVEIIGIKGGKRKVVHDYDLKEVFTY